MFPKTKIHFSTFYLNLFDFFFLPHVPLSGLSTYKHLSSPLVKEILWMVLKQPTPPDRTKFKSCWKLVYSSLFTYLLADVPCLPKLEKAPDFGETMTYKLVCKVVLKCTCHSSLNETEETGGSWLSCSGLYDKV